ncbi:MAG TPA: hypothetical protein VN329_16245 [Roseomonas sp.]|nr:hypothetical protein [Roseomonas sp.]
MLLRIAGLGLAGMALVTATAALAGATVAGAAVVACAARRRAKDKAAWPDEPPPAPAEEA